MSKALRVPQENVLQPITPVVPGFSLPVTTFAKDQPQYLALPSHRQPDGTVTTRWRLTWRERLRMVLTGDLWLQVLTFNHPLQPVKLATQCPIFGHMGDPEI